MTKIVKNFLAGMAIGMANIVPAFSGGTMAVILNVYDEIIEAISLEKIRSKSVFLLTIVSGIVLGVFIFSHVVKFCYSRYMTETNDFLLGMIIGSIPNITRNIQISKLTGTIRRTFSVIATVILVLATGYFLSTGKEIFTNINQNNMIMYLSWIFTVSFISGVCAVLPGISGSSMLVALGAYTTIVSFVVDLRINMLLLVVIGLLIGIILSTKALRFLLKRNYSYTYLLVLLLMIISIGMFYRNLEISMAGVIFIIMGVLISYMLGYKPKK